MNKKSIIIVSTFFLLYFILGLFLYKDYGIPWDESLQVVLGRDVQNYITGKSKHWEISTERYYGPAFEVLLTSVGDSLGNIDIRDLYFSRHLVTFLTFFAGVFAFFLLCKNYFKSWKIGLIGCLFLILSPRIFAHSFYNSKDIPFLAFFIFSIYTLYKFLDTKSVFWGIVHAFFTGFLISIRVVGVLVPAMAFVVFGLEILSNRKSFLQIFKGFFIYFVFLCGFTILLWPTLWHDPLSNLISSFKQMSKYPHDGAVLYFGQKIKSVSLPWHYLFVWLGITTPISYTIGFFAGIFYYIRKYLKKPKALFTKNKFDLIVLGWIFVPILSVLMLHSVLYDGWRQMYFIYPAFIIISIFGMQQIMISLKKRRMSFFANILFFLILLNIFSAIRFMYTSHPFQHVYFNELVKKRMYSFELDYWGLSYKNALEYIVRTDKREYIDVSVKGLPGVTNSYLLLPQDRKRLNVVEDLSPADYKIDNYRGNTKEIPPPDFSIKVNGDVIVGVYKLR